MSEKPFTVFVVEDDEWYNKLLVHNLSQEPGLVVESFTSAAAFLGQLRRGPRLVTLDYKLPDSTGAEVLRKIKAFDDQIEVVVISEQEDVQTAVNMLKDGATDYMVKDDNIRQKLLNVIARLREKHSLKQRISLLQQEVGRKYAFRNILLGNSRPLHQVFELMNKAIDTNIPVSVTGETGTGKELVAKAIHYNSQRSSRSFVAVNMSAVPGGLAESELFGHEKGAFTGAVAQRTGKFEEAHGGTLFLDEVAEMSPALQAKLLRVLQEKEITRVGGNQVIRVDCRIIVATHRNLPQEVQKGAFREDLYYRLLGLPINLPPLRERGDDILLLARHFADEFCRENNIQPMAFADSARNKLLSYHWPGNVRELKSVVELAAVLAAGPTIEGGNINLTIEADPMLFTRQEMTLREFNHKILEWYLNRYDQQVKVVAQKLDISPATVYRMLKSSEEK